MKPSCVECKKEVSTPKVKRCWDCFVQYNQGKNCWQYKGGKPKCLDCNSSTTQYNTKRCRSCYIKTMRGKTSPRYKGAFKSTVCLVCNKEFFAYKRTTGKAKYCSFACISVLKKNVPMGEKAYNWVKDRTLLKDDSKERGGQLHREWSKCVKNRDGWKCKIANSDCSGRMESHHILGWRSHPELRYSLTNGITLCHFHHPRKRNDEIRLSPYFQELIKAN